MTAWVTLVLLTLFSLPAFAQDSPPPLTPGAVALAVSKPRDEARPLVARALLDPNPATRLVAGRVVLAAPHPELISALVGALAREQDNRVAAEFVRDLLLLGGPQVLDFVKPQVKRRGGKSALAYAEWLARMQPKRLAQELPELSAYEGVSRELSDFVTIAVEQDEALREPLLRSWMTVAPEDAWGATLVRLLGSNDALHDTRTVLEDALRSERASVRAETVWFLIDELSEPLSPPGAVLDAALPHDGSAPADWESLGRELIARIHRHVPMTDRNALLRALAPDHHDAAVAARRFPGLTDGERGILENLSARPGSARSVERAAASMRTVPYFAPGVIESTLAAAGCSTGENAAYGVAVMTYAADGRPKHIQIDPTGLTPECQASMSALARLTVARSVDPVQAADQTLVLPLTTHFVACTSGPWGPPGEPDLPHGNLPQVRKVHDRAPVYPAVAQREHVQGVVTLEAEISPAGCIRSEAIIRSIPPLDLVSLAAVSEWEYEPYRMEGVPMTVLMTVTVNFELK